MEKNPPIKMKLFKNNNDPDYPGEKIVNLKDVMIAVWLCLIIGSGIVAVYTLIWAAWPAFRTAMTVLVTACIFLILTVAFFPED